jgi:hypothetical protein
MSLITSAQRAFFFVIFLAALLVAILGLFMPALLASIFTWLVLPPLHARFVGAIYAFGAFFMLGCLLARRQAEVRGAVQLIGVWTGMLLVISVLNISAFDFTLLPVKIWFASYILYPLIAIFMTIRQPEMLEASDLPGPGLSAWAKWFLLFQGILFTLLAVFLFFFPALMVTLWPWKVTQVLAQMYAGPLLAYGLGSLIFSRQDQWIGVRAIVPAMVIFTDATLVVSLIHFDVFSAQGLSTAIWFGWFAIATLVLLLIGFAAVQVRE